MFPVAAADRLPSGWQAGAAVAPEALGHSCALRPERGPPFSPALPEAAQTSFTAHPHSSLVTGGENGFTTVRADPGRSPSGQKGPDLWKHLAAQYISKAGSPERKRWVITAGGDSSVCCKHSSFWEKP